MTYRCSSETKPPLVQYFPQLVLGTLRLGKILVSVQSHLNNPIKHSESHKPVWPPAIIMFSNWRWLNVEVPNCLWSVESIVMCLLQEAIITASRALVAPRKKECDPWGGLCDPDNASIAALAWKKWLWKLKAQITVYFRPMCAPSDNTVPSTFYRLEVKAKVVPRRD